MTLKVSTRSWTKPQLLSIPPAIKDKLEKLGLVPKFVDFKMLNDRIGEGFEPVKRNGDVATLNPDGTCPSDGLYRCRELVLCAMPKEMADQKRAYSRGRFEERMNATNRFAKAKDEINKANSNCNSKKGTDGESFVKPSGKITVSRGDRPDLSPLPEDQAVENDARSIDVD